MSNHYHLLAYFDDGRKIPKLMNLVNGGSSFLLMKGLNRKGITIWDDYHMRIPKNERALMMIKGYVVGNPIKHLEVKNFDQLKAYPFSSFSKVIEEENQETAEAMVKTVITGPIYPFCKEI
ncbi:MAG: hypothetical protein UX09_C0036G0002 [Candidatus Uhrbacteria bacterium GW2011_GWE2_45_35]|uniref:Transposase IS200-like domain-containing protein n=2 Tax=Candidatus Uhriibacteriota TaxID=1752732 RepID=A0A0G1LN23_9BACT|nr:MAG: hypothetical protein UW63_C0035G0010 [Candidatus Uhrbacteria bacterium GW2011_GWF2_44_350]KKU07023.1 MAG: hypothetical protein UX09_C0036G0002 [Candidatus Uhrbacteria bacterium GW2011_GWE2_45_35]